MAAFSAAVLFSAALSLAGWRWYWAGWTGLSLAAFLAYGFDKLQAKKGGARTPEIQLHLLALAGGVAGAWLGRLVFRHKTRQRIFGVVLALAGLVHGALIFWLAR